MRKLSLLLPIVLLIGGLHAQTEIWTKITATPGAASMSIAIADFAVPGARPSPLTDAADTIHSVIIKDLANSLFFHVVPGESIHGYSSESGSIDFTNWAKTGASVLVAGDVSESAIIIRIYDLLSMRLVASKNYDNPHNSRALGHRIADEIIRLLTGEEGISNTRIVFSRKHDGSRELYSVDKDGQNLQQLTSDGAQKVSPDWSSDGSRIAYSAYWGSQLVVFCYHLSNRSVTMLCDKADMNDAPAWSPDGSMLALALSSGEGMELYTADANGHNLQTVTRNSAISTSPTWSPNGKQLAFVSDRSGGPQVYTIGVDGTGQSLLTFEGNYNTSPAWSPRGDIIAFSRREGYGNQICITDPTGANNKQLTYSGNNVEPCFSPDGLHIAFISDRDGPDDIYVMNWDGTDQHRLTKLGGCSAPSWSPPLKD